MAVGKGHQTGATSLYVESHHHSLAGESQEAKKVPKSLSSCLPITVSVSLPLKATRSQREREAIMRHREISQDIEKETEDVNESSWQMEKIHLVLQPHHSWYFLGLSLSHCDWINLSLYLRSLFLCLFVPLSVSLLWNNLSLAS